LAGSLSVSLPLLKVGVLGCVAVDVAPPYQKDLEGISSVCLHPGFSGRISKVAP
jgi:hypothetical protein